MEKKISETAMCLRVSSATNDLRNAIVNLEKVYELDSSIINLILGKVAEEYQNELSKKTSLEFAKYQEELEKEEKKEKGGK